MDYETARHFLVSQGKLTELGSDTFLGRLRQGRPPVPGQITSILLALKVVFEALREVSAIERELVYALHVLASESRHFYELGRRQGVAWPPLLDEDLTRIAIAVRSIFSGTWDDQ